MKRGFASADLTQLIVGAALVGLSLAAPQSARAQYPIFLALGEGQASCGEFLDAVQAERKAREPRDPVESYRVARYGAYLNFADGFVSGANFGDPTYRTVGQNTEHTGRMRWLENYCRANPLNGFLDAVVSLRSFLVSGR
jgi:hypothetical protein